MCTHLMFFSSPALKAQVSFSNQNLSVVCRRWRRCHCCKFSHFHLLLQNHRADFKQTWHKASLGKGDSVSKSSERYFGYDNFDLKIQINMHLSHSGFHRRDVCLGKLAQGLTCVYLQLTCFHST